MPVKREHGKDQSGLGRPALNGMPRILSNDCQGQADNPALMIDYSTAHRLSAVSVRMGGNYNRVS
jgi:hypothetical protein